MDAISALSPSVHLIGIGKVGRALLRELARAKARVVAVTDSSGTLYRREGLNASEIAKWKEDGNRIESIPGAKPISLHQAVQVLPADVVVDATPSDLDSAGQKQKWYGAALSRGAALVTAAKDALCIDPKLLHQEKIGFHAALGGTGLRLVEERDWLQSQCQEMALVANASSTALIQAFERGQDWESALASCQERGILEPNPESDLDGSDAAIKLTIVANHLFGWEISPSLIEREHLRQLDPKEIWWRAQQGLTTRYVARAQRNGALRIASEPVPRNSSLAVSSDRVAYQYRLDGEQIRLHIGFGIGPQGTARALLQNLKTFHKQAIVIPWNGRLPSPNSSNAFQEGR